TRAALSFTLAVPCSWFTPGGMSPLASARVTAAAAPPRATIRSNVRLRSSIAILPSGPAALLEHDVPHAMAEPAPAPLELGLRPPCGALREARRGVAQRARRGEEREHLVRIVAPIGGHVQPAA